HQSDQRPKGQQPNKIAGDLAHGADAALCIGQGLTSSIELLDKVLLPPCDQNILNPPKTLIHQSEALGIGLRDLPAKAHQTTSYRTVDEGIATAKDRQAYQSNRRVIEDNGPRYKQGQRQARDHLHHWIDDLLGDSLALGGDLFGQLRARTRAVKQPV